MTMKGETLEFPVTAPGASKAADDITKAGDSMKKAASQWDNMSQKSAKATAALGAMGNALGPLGANFGILGQSVSRATGIISSMTTLVGGPWAVAIGAAAIGIGVLAKKFSEAKDKADELRKSMVEQWAAEVEIERKRRSDARAADAEQKRFAEQGAADFMAGEIRSGRVRIKADPRDVKGKKGGGGGFKPSATQFGEASDFGDPSDPFADPTAVEENLAAVAEINAEFDRVEKDAAKERERAFRDEMREIKRAEHKAEMESLRELEERQKQFHDVTIGSMEDTAKIGIRTANEAVKGAKISGKAVMQSIGDALVARGTQAILEGGIFSATPFMWGSGTPMIAAGGVAIAMGMTLGAASRGMSGGGSVSSGKTTGTPQLAPATPVALDRTGGNAGPTTIVVNVPTVLSASGEDGKRIADAVAQAQREGRL